MQCEKARTLTLVLHRVNVTPEEPAVHERLTLVLARRQHSEKAHPAVVEGGHLVSRGDAPQGDVGVGVGNTAGDGHSAGVHGDHQLIGRLGDERNLCI